MSSSKLEAKVRTTIMRWREFSHFLENKQKYYNTWTQKTKKKHRKISAPIGELLKIHTKLLPVLNGIEFPDCITGFAPGTSVKMNAMVHPGKRIVSSYDIKDFFPNCKKHILSRALKTIINDPKVISRLVEISTFNGGLPQGSKISPVLANLSFMEADAALTKLAEMNEGVYSRYADDFTISSSDIGIYQLERYIENIVEDHGFTVNARKTRHHTQKQRQTVTGVVVNKKPQPNKQYRYNLKSQIHNLVRDNVKISKKHLMSINGMVNWVAMFNPEFVDRFLKPNLLIVKSRR